MTWRLHSSIVCLPMFHSAGICSQGMNGHVTIHRFGSEWLESEVTNRKKIVTMEGNETDIS